MPEIVTRLTQKFPNTELEIYPLPSLQVTRKIIDGQIDFGVVASPIKQPELISKIKGQDFLATFKKSPDFLSPFIFLIPETQLAGNLLKKYNHMKKYLLQIMILAQRLLFLLTA